MQSKWLKKFKNKLFFRFLLSNFKLSVEYKDSKSDTPITHLEKFVKSLEESELSILSPRIMSMSARKSPEKQMLSPDILSFQDTGLVPLPRILSVSYLC
jgi:hypothetical protein